MKQITQAIIGLNIVLALRWVSGCDQEHASSTQLQHAGNSIGNLRGYEAIAQSIGDGLYSYPGERFNLSPFLPFRVKSEKKVLGFFDFNSFRAGTPNGFSMFLWRQILWNVAGDIAKICDGMQPRYPLQGDVRDEIDGLCDPHWNSWSLRLLWWRLIGFQTESQVFQDFVSRLGDSEVAALSDNERVQLILFSLFIHPEFFLEN